MLSGFSLGLGARAAKSSSVYDPAALTLSGWWRADYSASPWTGTASAGGSGSRNLTAGTAPGTGTTQNGYTPADYNGSTHYLVNATAFSTFCTYAAGSIAVLFLADSATADAGAGLRILNPGLVFQDTGGTGFGLGYSSSGVTVALYDGGAYIERAVAAATGSYHLAFCRWDSSNLELGVDSGAMSSIAAGAIDGASTGGLVTGADYSTAAFFDGRILEIITAASKLTDTDRSNIRSYVNSRYALAL